MKNKINKIVKLIENLQISNGWDEMTVFSPILEIILKKQNFNMTIFIKFIIKFIITYMKNAKFVKIEKK